MAISNSMSYEEVLVEILDLQVHRLRTKDVALVKVLWSNQKFEEATLEAKEDMHSKYHSFSPLQIIALKVCVFISTFVF